MPTGIERVNWRVEPLESGQPLTLAAWLGIRPQRERLALHRAYHGVVRQARDPMFFRELGVPDTLDGRFEVLAIHLFLLLNRLKGQSQDAAAFAQAVFNAFFADMDRSLREMGASDLGVGRRVRAMAEGFYGRIAAYESGFAAGDGALGQALTRNLYGTVPVPKDAVLDAAVHYLQRQREALALTPTDRLLQGDIPFLPVGEAASIRQSA